MVIGTVNSTGGTPACTAIAPMTGSRVAVVAALLVSSVRKMTRVTEATTRTAVPQTFSGASCSPSHSARPLSDTAPARLSPPPKRISTPQGRRLTSSQTIRRGCDTLPLGNMNNNIAAVITMPVSVMPLSPNHSLSGWRNIQKNTSSENTVATRRSAFVIGPSSSRSTCRCSRTASLAGM